jgi:undecaprenyl diphosphate synthase
MNNNTIPQHIAIIMDGNRRWAKEHNLPVLEGHRRVVDDILEPLIEHASELGVKYLTFWAWSTENWRRDQNEVRGIMQIFHHVVARKWQKLHEKGVKIKIIGDIASFDQDLQKSIHDVVEQTKNNTKITTTFALNYGGRDEIMRAIQRMMNDELRMTNDPLKKEEFGKYLDTAGDPDPDLIIRTGGEQRLSGFLLWQSEYSELYFPDFYMPDFTPEKLDEALVEFAKRKRNFGK